MGAVVQTHLNRSGINFDASGAGALGNLLYIEFENSFGVTQKIKHLSFGVFSNITPHTDPATTVITVISLAVYKNLRFNPAVAYSSLPAADRVFFGALTGRCFGTGQTERFYDFPDGLNMAGAQSGLIVVSGTVEAAGNLLGVYVNSLSEESASRPGATVPRLGGLY
jgi:hypothetical protein